MSTDTVRLWIRLPLASLVGYGVGTGDGYGTGGFVAVWAACEIAVALYRWRERARYTAWQRRHRA